ncbi:MAG: hypothetical protein AAB365_01405 [Patescibacteria group bacterium]
MRLELTSEDLEPKYKNCNASQTTFAKFTEAVQNAIHAVGQATYFGFNRDTHKVIYPPRDKKYERFHVEDTVYWNESYYPSALASMKQAHGDGPFTVVTVRLHPVDIIGSTGHPESVTIQNKEGHRDNLSGAWFTKKKPS